MARKSPLAKPVLLCLALLGLGLPLDAASPWTPRPKVPLPCLEAVPPALDFGTTAPGSVLDKPVNIRNRCSRAVTIHRISTRPGAFAALARAPWRIGPRSARDLPVRFRPAAEGAYTGRIVLESAGPVRSGLRIALRGVAAVPPALAFDPDSIALTLAPGDTSIRTLAIRNDMDEPVGLTFRTVVEPVGSFLPTRMKVLYYTTTLEEGIENNFLHNLQGQAKIGTVTVRSGTGPVPSAAELSAYDAVVVSALDPWSDPVAAGDVLADYADQGGRLILMDAALSTGGFGFGLEGRITTSGYSPVAGAGPGGPGWAETFPAHPLMEGVAYVGTGYTMAVDTVQGPAEPLGVYDNGRLVGAYSTARRIVWLNVLPVEGDYQAGEEMERLIANCLDFLQGTWNWIKVPEAAPGEPYPYVLAPGETAEVPVTLGHARNLPAGTHPGYVEFWESGTGSAYRVPVRLQVEGSPD